MNKVYFYKCPECGKEIIYKSKHYYENALNNKVICRTCKDKKKGLENKYIRKCPECGKQITYKWSSDFYFAQKENTLCRECVAKHSKTTFKKGDKQHQNNKSAQSKYSLDNLLLNSLESFYWLGFILADGCFYKHRFEFALKKNDLQQVKNLAAFLNIDENLIKYRKSTNSYRFYFNNEKSITEVMKNFGIHYCKTYEPCDFNFYKNFSYKQLISLLIGLVDGDGCVSKDGKSISISAHKNWKKFYVDLINNLNLKFYINEVNNTNSIRISAGNKETRQLLKNFIEENKLPILERKWKRII